MPNMSTQPPSPRSVGRGSPPVHSSPALEWIWKYLADLPAPRIMDCGPVSQATVDVLVRRGAKIYIADLVTPLLRNEAQFWERRGKIAVFRTDLFLSQLLPIEPGSLTAVFGWSLLDLLPHEAHAAVVAQWLSYLRPGGILFCILREPRLAKGAETAWWLDGLTTLGTAREGVRPFAHPVVTNREVEKLCPQASVKTFLTRSGWREVVVLQGEGN
jgi:hypothetical protein